MKTNRKFLIISIINFVILTFLLGFFFLYSFFFAQSVSDLYSDFGGEMPMLTTFFIKIANFFSAYWYILFPLMCIIFLIVSLFIGYMLRKVNFKRLIIIYIIVVSLMLCGVVSFMTIIVYIPIYNLAEIVS